METFLLVVQLATLSVCFAPFIAILVIAHGQSN
jgi:hypothetical protein